MTMDVLSPGLLSALGLAAMLGLRHGFDADHIAVVDGMTRARQLHRADWSARLVGLQFAAGHSTVILGAALLLFGQGASLPTWLDGLGAAVSAVLLLVIAVSNLAHALAPPTGAGRPMTPVAALLFRLTGRQLHPLLVGAAFAISLDALAQAAFFAAQGGSAGPHSGLGGVGGMAAVALLGAAFGAGMMLADAGNGLLLAWFAQRSDRLAQQASRWSSAFIALVALATLTAVLLRETRAGFAQVWDSAGIWTGLGLVLLTSAVYAAGLLLQRTRKPTLR